MKEVMVTMKFRESEINMLYQSLKIMADTISEAKELRDALKNIKQRIHNEKEKAKDIADTSEEEYTNQVCEECD